MNPGSGFDKTAFYTDLGDLRPTTSEAILVRLGLSLSVRDIMREIHEVP